MFASFRRQCARSEEFKAFTLSILGGLSRRFAFHNDGKTRKLLTAIVNIWLAVAVLSATSMAQSEPMVRIDVSPDDVAVGESVALTVTVLGPTWFPTPPTYPTFELANAVTRLPPDSSYPMGEDVEGERWSGIVREYQVFPLIDASYHLSGQVMTVTYSDPETRKPVSVEVDVPDIAFTASVPSDAESLEPYIAGNGLTLNREIDGELDLLEAGDALVVRYVAELDGLPAIFLPPMIDPTGVPGVSVYADQPVVEEGPPSRRTEKLTFVFEAGGEFTLPGVELRWWNMEEQQIETAGVVPLAVTVAGPPLAPPAEEEADPPVDWVILADWLALLFAAWWLLSRLAPSLKARWKTTLERYRNSEPYAFRKVRKTLQGKDPREAYTALLTWLDLIEPGLGTRVFALRFGDARLQEQLENLSRSLYRNSGDTINIKDLQGPLKEARRKAKQSYHGDSHQALPPLNP